MTSLQKRVVNSGSTLVGIFALLVGLSQLADAGPLEIKEFHADSIVEGFRDTWRQPEPPVSLDQVEAAPLVRLDQLATASLEFAPLAPAPRVAPVPRARANDLLGLSPAKLRNTLKLQSSGNTLDRKGIEATISGLGLTIDRAPHRPPILRQRGKSEERPSEFAGVFPLLQRIEYRNQIVGGLHGLRRLRVLDGHKQLAHHLRKAYGRTTEQAAALAASFDPRAQVHEYETTTDDLRLLRLYGGGSGKLGKWFFCCLDNPDARGTALPIGNTMEQMATVRVPSTTRMLVGVAADQKDPSMRFDGGNTQFFIPDGLPVPDSAYSEYEMAKANNPLSPDDLLVARDDGSTVRFRPVHQGGGSDMIQPKVPKLGQFFPFSPVKAAGVAGE